MRRTAFTAILLTLILTLAGCNVPNQEPLADEVLQLNNDILEDPLLKEMDALEEALLTEEPAAAAPAEPTALGTESPKTAERTSAEPLPEPAQPTGPAAPPAAGSPQESPTVQTDTTRKILFGNVKRTIEGGIALRIIEAKTLTPDELRRIKNGEKIPQVLLTDEVLKLQYSDAAIFEKMSGGTSIPAKRSDVASGQTVRVTLDRAGEIILLRIIRN